MNIQMSAVTVSAVLLMPISGNAIAQTTYAELETRGIKAISGDALKQLLSGSRMKGEFEQGNPYELEFAADGALGGWISDAKTRKAHGVSGKWSVNEKQQYCWDYTISSGKLRVNGCRRLFRLGGDYYIPVAGQGKEAKMGQVAITK